MDVAGKNEFLVAFCTFPDAETARRVVHEIIEAQLAACGNIVPQIHSIYQWQGKVESSDEALALFKLDATCYGAFEKKLRSLHPYDVPEIISCKIENGLPEYLRWVADSCTT